VSLKQTGDTMQRRELAVALKQLDDVLERRQFCKLVGGALVAIPAGLFLVRCGGSNQTANGPTNQPSQDGTRLIFTSSVVGDHSHTFGIETAAIDTPPANGVNGPSSVVESHSHSVVVSSAQLSSIDAGETVQVTSGTTDGHTHLFTFLKLA
jgi:hypothetical protein